MLTWIFLTMVTLAPAAPVAKAAQGRVVRHMVLRTATHLSGARDACRSFHIQDGECFERLSRP